MGKEQGWGVPYTSVSPLTLRHLLACRVITEFYGYVSSAPVSLGNFDSSEMLRTAYQTPSDSERRAGPNRVIKSIMSESSDYKQALEEFRAAGPLLLRPFAESVVQYAFYVQLRPYLENVELLDSMDRAQAKIARSFEAAKLYRNPLFSPGTPAVSFTFESVRHGLAHHRESIRSEHLPALNLAGLWRVLRASPASSWVTRGEKPSETPRSQITNDIMAEYERIHRSLPVEVNIFDEEAIIKETMSNPEPTFRNGRRVLKAIRHNYTNYDRLYFSDEVRRHPLWLATGYRASRRAVYASLLEVARTALITETLETEIRLLDEDMEKYAVQAGRCRRPEWFIRNAYITSINKNIENDEKRLRALSYAK